MKIGIIGPSKLKEKELVSKVAKIISSSREEVYLVPDKGSTSEFFAKEYLKLGGTKVYSLIPFDDKEFGYSWVNQNIGEKVNCGTWRNQPEKMNEEVDCLVSLGYSVGGIIEMSYSKWFGKHAVYIIEEFISEKLPNEFEEGLDLRYVSIKELEKTLS